VGGKKGAPCSNKGTGGEDRREHQNKEVEVREYWKTLSMGDKIKPMRKRQGKETVLKNPDRLERNQGEPEQTVRKKG